MDMVNYANNMLKNVVKSSAKVLPSENNVILKLTGELKELIKKNKEKLELLERLEFEEKGIPSALVPSREFYLGKIVAQNEILEGIKNALSN